MLDQFGNYICDIGFTMPSPLPSSGGGGASGVGVPNNADGDDGDTYVNITNGDFYTKSGGVWIQSGLGIPGGSGASGVGSPEGVVSASPGTSYVDTAPPYDVYFKVSGAGNTGWVMKVE